MPAKIKILSYLEYIKDGHSKFYMGYTLKAEHSGVEQVYTCWGPVRSGRPRVNEVCAITNRQWVHKHSEKVTKGYVPRTSADLVPKAPPLLNQLRVKHHMPGLEWEDAHLGKDHESEHTSHSGPKQPRQKEPDRFGSLIL
jgi:hypothetical protein